MTKLKLRLTLDVEYDVPKDIPVKEAEERMKGQLNQLIQTGANEGLISGYSEITVDTYNHTVKVR